jgi:ABC-type transport system involved in cytochrome bd biosynthesis fused ATPase/permease subunit
VNPPRLPVLDELTANVALQSETVIEALIDDITAHGDKAGIAVAHAENFGRNARVVAIGNGVAHG